MLDERRPRAYRPSNRHLSEPTRGGHRGWTPATTRRGSDHSRVAARLGRLVALGRPTGNAWGRSAGPRAAGRRPSCPGDGRRRLVAPGAVPLFLPSRSSRCRTSYGKLAAVQRAWPPSPSSCGLVQGRLGWGADRESASSRRTFPTIARPSPADHAEIAFLLVYTQIRPPNVSARDASISENTRFVFDHDSPAHAGPAHHPPGKRATTISAFSACRLPAKSAMESLQHNEFSRRGEAADESGTRCCSALAAGGGRDRRLPSNLRRERRFVD